MYGGRRLPLSSLALLLLAACSEEQCGEATPTEGNGPRLGEPCTSPADCWPENPGARCVPSSCV